jgi:hypothetical protein
MAYGLPEIEARTHGGYEVQTLGVRLYWIDRGFTVLLTQIWRPELAARAIGAGRCLLFWAKFFVRSASQVATRGRAGVQRNKAGVNWLLVGMKVGQACQSPASPASPLDNRAINIYFHTLKKFKKI